jgi:hypothetical protein
MASFESNPSDGSGVFDPEATHAMSVAFDEICRAMNLPKTATVAREIVAIRVIDLARDGEMGASHLRDRVLREARSPIPWDEDVSASSKLDVRAPFGEVPAASLSMPE